MSRLKSTKSPVRDILRGPSTGQIVTTGNDAQDVTVHPEMTPTPFQRTPISRLTVQEQSGQNDSSIRGDVQGLHHVLIDPRLASGR